MFSLIQFSTYRSINLFDPPRFVSILIVFHRVENDWSNFGLQRSFGTISINRKMEKIQHDYNLRHVKLVRSRYPRLVITLAKKRRLPLFASHETHRSHEYAFIRTFSSLTSSLESFEYTILAVRFNDLPRNYRCIR